MRMFVVFVTCVMMIYASVSCVYANESTFAQMLKDSSCKTMVAGKWQLDGQSGTLTKNVGFDSWLLWNTQLAMGKRYWNPLLERNGELITTTDSDYGPDMCVEKLYGNGLFYDLNKDREELHPIPPEKRDAEQQALVKTFQAAIESMPKTNKHYTGKPVKVGRLQTTYMNATIANLKRSEEYTCNRSIK